MYIQIIVIIIAAVLLVRVGIKYKKRDITLKEAFLWALVWLGAGLLVLYPKAADKLASIAGLETATGIDLAAYVAVGLAFYLIFRILVRLDKIERDMTKVVREVALRNGETDHE